MQTSCLAIKELHVHVTLGWPDKERLEKQTVTLNIEIVFPAPPVACQTDKLEDTVCYSALIEALKDTLETKTFHLVEHLANEAYHQLKKLLPKDSFVQLSVLKHPTILGLSGGITFSYGDSMP